MLLSGKTCHGANTLQGSVCVSISFYTNTQCFSMCVSCVIDSLCII